MHISKVLERILMEQRVVSLIDWKMIDLVSFNLTIKYRKLVGYILYWKLKKKDKKVLVNVGPVNCR